MPGKRASPAQKNQFWTFISAGLSPEMAAEKVGVSAATAYRWMRGVKRNRKVDATTLMLDLPEPKRWEDLDGGVRDLLKEFNLFCEVLLCRRPAAWRHDAAMRTVEWLLDKTERTYAVVNVFPGSGKTTLFTHDLEAWLIAGGGICDPAYGRALRIMLGSETKNVSVHYVLRLRRFLELRRPFYDKEQKRQAELSPVDAFGRFRPLPSQGEESLWRNDQFLVAQMQDVDLYEKEPTVQAASRESGFLGERVDLAAWDDLVTKKNSRNPEVAETLAEWDEDEAETRIEPGGVLLKVGQRLGPLDLYRNRLDQTYTDEQGESRLKYEHVVYPAHNEETCDGDHRQWDLKQDGCLLDESRLPWREVIKLQSKPNFRTVYQQEDADPSQVLVLPVWLDGGIDPFGFDAPGCYDRERGWLEHPEGVMKLVDYATVDPSAGNWWAIEWWVVHPETKYNYLIFGIRERMKAGQLLDWNQTEGRFVGYMEDMMQASIFGGHPIRVWVIEANAAHKYLFQYDHYRRWLHKYPWLTVIAHTTGRNKATLMELGVEGTLPMRYRIGLKRLPGDSGVEGLNYLRVKRQELTTYPQAPTDDTVMSDWIGEFNLERIIRLGTRPTRVFQVDAKLPPYLLKQRRALQYEEVPV